jgi:hypothetical protein
MIFVVSIVSDTNMDKLRNSKSSIAINVDQEKMLRFAKITFKIHTLLELLCLEVIFFQQTAIMEWMKLLW